MRGGHTAALALVVGLVLGVGAPTADAVSTAHHRHKSRQGRKRAPAGAVVTSPAPPTLAPTRAQPTTAIEPSVPGARSSGPSLALLVALITALGAVAVLVLRLRPHWFIRGEPPAAR
jgi:hypothetical protein